jgi:hypothetical protein
MIGMDLIVIVRDIARSEMASGAHASLASELLVCDRCHDIEEIVVAIIQALPLQKRWALCGACKQELPEGFYLV